MKKTNVESIIEEKHKDNTGHILLSPSRREFVATGVAGAGLALAGCLGSSGGGDTAKIGVLEDRSGTFAIIGDPKWKASTLAVEEINEEGGILDTEVEMFDPDPQSDPQRYQQFTEEAIQSENVDALFATYASPHRETIRPIINDNEQLYFYTTQYEGGVCDSYTFCTGATARQQIGKVMPYLTDQFGDQIYTLAPDYNFGTLSAEWVQFIADELGAEVIDEEFFPASESEFGSTINRIQEADPDYIMSFLTGRNQLSFYDQRLAAGIEGIPIGTTTGMMDAYEHIRFDPPTFGGVYAPMNYMQEIDTELNPDFVDRYYERFPDAEYINASGGTAYYSVYLYKEAVERAGTFEQAEVIAELENGIEMDTIEGAIRMNGDTHHISHQMRIAIADSDHNVSFEEQEQIDPGFMENLSCDLTEEADSTQYEPSDLN